MTTERWAFGGRQLLLDKSAWARSHHPAVREEWSSAVRASQIVISPPFLLEALYSARNAADYADSEAEFRQGFDHVGTDAQTWSLALRSQQELAQVEPSFHRRPPIDLLLASIAHQSRLAILHYDADFDKISRHTSLKFESEWIAPPGSL